jgi:hypothetical protein
MPPLRIPTFPGWIEIPEVPTSVPGTVPPGSIGPDILGFEEAQRRQHSFFDGDVVFRIPPVVGDVTYPAGTSFDPETGLPFDPVVEATGDTDEFTEITVKAAVVRTVLSNRRLEDESRAGALGVMEEGNLVLILQTDVKPTVEDATEVVALDERWEISEWRPDGLNSTDRWLVFAKEM